ncbi:MAG: NUDIX domain-containing protein [Proteobacteria bacterium]|nr:NUDIX domain-containing protein [Pseudomonadota bacterium]
MKRRRIQPGWRYSLAQWLLRGLFGRPWHSISPWLKAGPAVAILVTNKGRVLLAKRGGRIEHVGCWSSIGGYVEVSAAENFPQAIVREFYEETGFRLDPAQFNLSPTLAYLNHGLQKIEEANASAVVGYYLVSADASLLSRLSPQEETTDFAWFTEEQCRAMLAEHQIPAEFTDLHLALEEIFRRINAGEAFPPLKLSPA